MSQKPLVSIIISAFNAEKYICATLDSVLSQTYPSVEVIVVNDGSTDDTLCLIEPYLKRGVKIISQSNKGQDSALNNGYNISKGSFVKFLDSDDLINAEMIALQMEVLDGMDDYVAYGEWARFYDNQPDKADFSPLDYWKDMNPIDFLTARPEGVMLQCGIMLVPRKIIELAGLWDERLILYNDTEFFNRILLKSKGVKFSKGARLYYRSGMIGSISAQRSRKFFESTFLATNLVAGQLLVVEDSYRVRNLISNTYINLYYQLYPRYPDLGKLYEERISFYGAGTVKPDGGSVFKILTRLFGWKQAKRIQLFFYKIGYKPHWKILLKALKKKMALKH
jgi:glycosyltransferase involved in cell wall biosynthesis